MKFILKSETALAKSRPMQISYRLTEQDFLQGILAHYNRTLVKRLFYWTIFLFAVTIVVGEIVAFLALGNIEWVQQFLPLTAVCFAWILLLAGIPRWSARLQYRKQHSAQGDKELRVDDAGLHWLWDGGSSDLAWKNMIRWVERKNIFLLYSSPACFNIVPKHALSDNQVEEFRKYLADHITRG